MDKVRVYSAASVQSSNKPSGGKDEMIGDCWALILQSQMHNRRLAQTVHHMNDDFGYLE
jgi:hypothetical protein